MVTNQKPRNAKDAARMRQPMTRGEVHALMTNALNTILAAMNELEGRIQALEPQGERRSASGLVLPASLGEEIPS